MKKKILLILALMLVPALLCSCNKGSSILNEYNLQNNSGLDYAVDSDLTYADGFASNIAVVPSDAENTSGSEKLHSESALLVDATTGEVLLQKNPHTKEYPASTTKILTSLLAIKYGDINASRKVGSEVLITESNVVLCDFREGDYIPFDIMIHGAMLKSGNDAAAALALFASDNLDDFAKLMNEEAKKLGATESNFVNPHGLFNENHYTTVYDMYLIFNEAIKNEYFVDVLASTNYTGTFSRTTAYGEYSINCSYPNTNQYISGQRTAPSYISVVGGKGGYTEVARRSYVMLANANGHQYIFVIMKSESVNEMYDDLDYLMTLIPDNSSSSEYSDDK